MKNTHRESGEAIENSANSLNRFEKSLRFNDKIKPDNLQLVKKYFELHEKQLKIRQKKVDKNKLRHIQLKAKFEDIEQKLKEATEKLQSQTAEEVLMNKLSVKIQKVYRGYITRKKLETSIFNARTEKMNNNLETMKEDKQFLMYGVGRMPEISACVIQRAYRRYKTRCYFNRLLTTFKIIQLQKEEENFRNLKENLRVLICKKKKNQKVFEKYRKNRLLKIKEKLALLKIKQIFKRKKLKKQVIIEKIKKFKRRLRAAEKRKKQIIEALFKENDQVSPEELEKIENMSIGSVEDFETTTSDREAEERAQMLKKFEEERKTRIHFGKISYNLRELKLPKILTSLHQKEVPLGDLRIPQTNPVLRQRNKLVKRTDFPRRSEGDEPSYMRTTISFNFSKVGFKNESFEEEKVKSFAPKRKDSTLFEPTKASLLKITQRRSFSADEEEPRNSSNHLISVKIKEKPRFLKKSSNEFKKELDRKNESSREGFVFPEISTRHQILPVKVKPRAEIMKGFTKVKKVKDQEFEIN